jgi:RNA polymerase sigma-70 factor, ECF subfamily
MDVARLHPEQECAQTSRPAARVLPLRPAGQQQGPPSADELSGMVRAIAVAQDRAAFATLFGHFAPRVKAFLVRSGLADGLAEEVTQETMLAMWRKASFFDPSRAGVSTWIFTIARSQRIDRLRRERLPSAELPAEAIEEPDPSDTAEEAVFAAEREGRVRAALGALSAEQAAIVRLSFFADKPHAEIARELGLPLGTVKSRIRLALKRLRGLLDGDA